MAVGLSFEDTVTAITTHPRETMGLTPVPRTGQRAAFTLFRVDDTRHDVSDSLGNHATLDRMLEPVATLIGADWQPAGRRGS